MPSAFDEYQHFNKLKQKKQKMHPLSATDLKSHGECLYSLLMKPFVNNSPKWEQAATDIKNLADCLIAYSSFLKRQAESTNRNHMRDRPVRSIAEHATIEHRTKNPFGILSIADKYQKLDAAVTRSGVYKAVIFDE